MSNPKRTVRQIIQKALQKISVYAVGETISADDMNDGLMSFQDMVAEWAGDGMLIPALIQESFSLVNDKVVYTIGEDDSVVAPDILTVRPEQIITAFVREDTIDYPVRIIGERAYASLTDKFNGGSRPEYLWYNPTAPNGTISIYRAPAGNYSMFITSLKAFPDNAKITDDAYYDLGVPRTYHNPIIYNLAVELAPEFGVDVSAVVATRAINGLANIRSLTAANRVQPANCEFAKPHYGNYDLVRYR